jgi:uncharacterized protein YjbI with pentapeptide repeats
MYFNINMMTKEEMVNLLKTDIVAWNNFRKDNPDAKIDLSGVNLDDEDLRGADLHNADFRNACIMEANFLKANLKGADFRGADLSCTKFSFADLSDADLSGADIRYIKLNRTIKDGTKGIEQKRIDPTNIFLQ